MGKGNAMLSRIKPIHRAIVIAVVDTVLALVFLAILGYAIVHAATGQNVHPAVAIATAVLGLGTGSAVTSWRTTYVQARAIIAREQRNTTP